MKIHHLNLCTLCPYGGRWMTGTRSVLDREEIVVHALFVEMDRDGRSSSTPASEST
jgi:hypothetical protein